MPAHPEVSRRRVYRRRRRVALLFVGVAVAAIVAAVVVPNVSSSGRPSHHSAPAAGQHHGPARSDPRPPSTAAAKTSTYRCPCPDLRPGSNPKVLPGPVLVADHMNDRLLIVDPNGHIAWQFPRTGDLAPGQTFKVPDDAFFSPDGKYILATQEDDYVISLIDVATHHIVWQDGTPGVPGSRPNQLYNPDDAIMTPNGDIILADIKNCRVLMLRPPYKLPLRIYGITTRACVHDPPQHWGSPNGAFPLTGGNYLVTEINGDWVDSLSLSGSVAWSTHPPGVSYPSDTNEVRPGVYLTSDYSNPGKIEEFTPTGQLVWRFTGQGPDTMNKPSLALPLPNGDILANDDYNHRVIVVSPHSNRIVWQYGHTAVSGTRPGYLNDPDGVDLLPPYSLAIAHASTMAQGPVPSGAPPVAGSDPASAATG